MRLPSAIAACSSGMVAPNGSNGAAARVVVAGRVVVLGTRVVVVTTAVVGAAVGVVVTVVGGAVDEGEIPVPEHADTSSATRRPAAR
ncbi:MAG TPA: hypothetical protein VJA44_01680 [Acidimicrobiia bacterium]|nr:hypothetical protein [Acidimicrobiia bacterium]